MTRLGFDLTIHGLTAILWIAFFGVFISARRKQPKETKKTEESAKSRIGIFLEGVAFFLMGFGDRTPWGNVSRLENPLRSVVPAVAGLAVLAAAVWLAGTAVGTLGKHWSLTARLVEGHELVTAGPYGFIRHPIYTALFGMLVGSLLVHSRVWVFAAAIPVFLLGTWIRIHEEDRLLRQRFGPDFETYRRRVAALIPGMW